jgi:hypothetical protein
LIFLFGCGLGLFKDCMRVDLIHIRLGGFSKNIKSTTWGDCCGFKVSLYYFVNFFLMIVFFLKGGTLPLERKMVGCARARLALQRQYFQYERGAGAVSESQPGRGLLDSAEQ